MRASSDELSLPLYFSRLMPTLFRGLLALGGFILITALDASVWAGAAFAPFYLLLIALTSWYVGPRAGTVVALASGITRPAIDGFQYGIDVMAIWNALLWTATFVALAQFVGWALERREEVTTLDSRVGELEQLEHSFARTDPLTSLCNRRAFIDALQAAEARSRRSGGALAVARLDLDGFRKLNETYARSDGDQLLRAVSTSLSLTTRMGDLAARLENDEFAILLYGCGSVDAQRVGQRLVVEIEELGRAYPEAKVTVSIGIACFGAAGPDPDEMMRRAGTAMRRAREAGGNTVVIEGDNEADVPRRHGDTEHT
jgi:diguanylate cyclase (GGDEF)-like protein